MKKISFTVLFTCLCASLIAQKNRTEVLILGTTHFFSIKDDSISGPKKQRELSVILDQLKRFDPQQVFVENPPENDKYFLEILKEIKTSGEETKQKWIVNNEIYQIGIKLCNKLKLPVGVEGIDWRAPNPDDSTATPTAKYEKAYSNFIKEVGMYAKNRLSTRGDSLIEDQEGFSLVNKYNKEFQPYYSINNKVSLKELLLFANNPENSRKWYYANRLPNLLSDIAGIGAEMSNVEIFRDSKIYRNALSRLRKDSKRILIIYGAAHAHILTDLFSMDERFKVVKVSDVIK